MFLRPVRADEIILRDLGAIALLYKYIYYFAVNYL
jgi:hypothetical protein